MILMVKYFYELHGNLIRVNGMPIDFGVLKEWSFLMMIRPLLELVMLQSGLTSKLRGK